MARLCLLACCALLPSFAADLTKDQLLLATIREKMALNLIKQPNYTCTQTIERHQRGRGVKRPRLTDVVRLEVALVDGRELFAWPGSTKFEDRELRDMIGSGMTGNGQFALFARSIFLTSVPRFDFIGERIRDDRRLVRWDYVVPQDLSGYTLRSETQRGDEVRAVVGYHGAIWADPDNHEVKRLEVHADNIPPHIPFQSASVAVEYQKVRINEADFLLPSTAEQEIVDLNGRSSVNRIQFNSCRQYTGESRLVFEDSSEGSTSLDSDKQHLKTLQLPPGIMLDTVLETPIRKGVSMVGDPVTFKLRRPAKLGTGLVAPKGALVHGRLTYLRLTPVWAAGFELHAIEFGDTRGELVAELDSLMGIQRPGDRYRVLRQPAAVQFGAPAASSLIIRESLLPDLPRGFLMVWRTVAISAKQSM